MGRCLWDVWTGSLDYHPGAAYLGHSVDLPGSHSGSTWVTWWTYLGRTVGLSGSCGGAIWAAQWVLFWHLEEALY